MPIPSSMFQHTKCRDRSLRSRASRAATRDHRRWLVRS